MWIVVGPGASYFSRGMEADSILDEGHLGFKYLGERWGVSIVDLMDRSCLKFQSTELFLTIGELGVVAAA